jgi:hypothetical protein
MNDILASYHFASLDEVPIIDRTTPFWLAFEGLAKFERGAFVVSANGLQAFIRARAFASAVFANAAGDAEEIARLVQTPIGDLLSLNVLAVTSVPVGPPVDARGDEAVLRAMVDTAFRVERNGQLIGWYLNHETVREATTEQAWFVCANPTLPHPNATPDHGRCSECPFPLAFVK